MNKEVVGRARRIQPAARPVTFKPLIENSKSQPKRLEGLTGK